MKRLRTCLIFALVLLLAGCASGGSRRVSEPAASIQQLTVRADGRWDVQLRLNNFSSMAMRFSDAKLDIAFDGAAVREKIGDLAKNADLSRFIL